MASPFQPLPEIGKRSNNESSNRDDEAGARVPPLLQTALRKRRILHVEFDRTLLAVRHALLETAGFEVVSCFSASASHEVSTATAPFDALLVGHAASVHERQDLITWVKANFPGTRVVVLRKRETDTAPAGDVSSTAEPEDLIRTLAELFKQT